MAEVFISYGREDTALIAPIAACLKDLGVDAWYDREISAGERFDAIIRRRLKEAKAVLVCWSPQAIESEWVEAEADYARQLGNYVPVFLAPCLLLPPFNRIQTDDLSNWKGDANDPAWIKLVDRIGKLIGRDGVAAAARALASGDEQARYDFARRFPDELAARTIWGAAEARHRENFKQRMAEARSAAEARIKAERAALDARLREAAPAFEAWLADERRGAAQGPLPDPQTLIEQAQPGEDPRLRDEIAALQSALAQAKAREGELNAAKAEIARLTKELTGLHGALQESEAREGELVAARSETAQLSEELTAVRSALARANATDGELHAAKSEVARVSKELARLTAPASAGPERVGSSPGSRLEVVVREPKAAKQQTAPSPSSVLSSVGLRWDHGDTVGLSPLQQPPGGRAGEGVSVSGPIENPGERTAKPPKPRGHVAWVLLGMGVLMLFSIVMMMSHR